MTMRHTLRLLALLLVAAASAYADPLGELAAFSSFKGTKLEALTSGGAKMGRGPSMSFPRGIAVESVYVVKRPLQKTADLHLNWTPTKHPQLKVYLHGNVSARPAPGDFGRLGSAPTNGAVKAFAAATRKLPGDRAGLQLSNAEAKLFGGDSGGGAMTPTVATFWGNVLHQRAQAYASGGLGKLPPYEVGGETISAADEIARLLKEAPKVREQFAGLINATPIGGGRGSLSPSHYWELVDVEGQAVVSLGAVYHKGSANSWQSAEVHYYASGGYYVLLTLQQMWPVTVGGEDATLVWRGDLISAASLASRKGVERMGSSTAMMRETQKSINAMLGDFAKAP